MKASSFAAVFALLSPLFGGNAFSQTPTPAPSQSLSTYGKKDVKAGLTSDGGQWGFHRDANADASLPRVLLIGDSILIGYRAEATRQLKGKASVDCLTTGLNIGLGKPLYDQIRSALEQGPYAVIHFNDMGLHGYQKDRIPDAKYEPLLKAYLDLIRTGAKDSTLIWTATTPITVKGNPSQLDPSDATIVERNAVAARVMKEFNIETDDLYGLMSPHLDLARGDGFHWKPEGQIMQGRQVAAAVEAALKARQTRTATTP